LKPQIQSQSLPRRKSDPAAPTGKRCRTVRLHASFSPPGVKKKANLRGLLEFQELVHEAEELGIQKRQERLAAEQQHIDQRLSVVTQSIAVLKSEAAGQISEAAARQKLWEIAPDHHTQRDFAEFLDQALERRSFTAEQIAAENLNFEAREREVAAAGELIQAMDRAQEVFAVLSNLVEAGEARAIQDVIYIAERAILLLEVAAKAHPDTTRKIAAFQSAWPVLFLNEPGFGSAAAERIQSLQLSSGLEPLRAEFRQARGADENYPARQWAKAAVRTIEETKTRALVFARYKFEFRMLILEGKAKCCDEPDWVNGAVKLPPFSTASCRGWGVVIKSMIREQVPEFHTLPVLQAQRNSAAHRCRATRGEIQNAILDDIVSALRRLAPPVKMPKWGS
jgi:hypothetical protein